MGEGSSFLRCRIKIWELSFGNTGREQRPYRGESGNFLGFSLQTTGVKISDDQKGRGCILRTESEGGREDDEGIPVKWVERDNRCLWRVGTKRYTISLGCPA